MDIYKCPKINSEVSNGGKNMVFSLSRFFILYIISEFYFIIFKPGTPIKVIYFTYL